MFPGPDGRQVARCECRAEGQHDPLDKQLSRQREPNRPPERLSIDDRDQENGQENPGTDPHHRSHESKVGRLPQQQPPDLCPAGPDGAQGGDLALSLEHGCQDGVGNPQQRDRHRDEFEGIGDDEGPIKDGENLRLDTGVAEDGQVPPTSNPFLEALYHRRDVGPGSEVHRDHRGGLIAPEASKEAAIHHGLAAVGRVVIEHSHHWKRSFPRRGPQREPASGTQPQRPGQHFGQDHPVLLHGPAQRGRRVTLQKQIPAPLGMDPEVA